MLEKKRLEQLVLEKLKTYPENRTGVSFQHQQHWWVGYENLQKGKIMVFVGPSPLPRWEREGQWRKRRTMFVSVRIVASCDSNDADRVEMLVDFSELLFNLVACMEITDGDSAAYNESAEFDVTSGPFDLDRMANNVFFTSFTLEFKDQQLFDRA